MRLAIIDKLNRHMSAAPVREADIVYALVEIRKLVEQEGARDKFPRLVFFCDWVAHPKLDRKEAKNILDELDRQFARYNPARPWEIDPGGIAHDFMSFQQFRRELREYLKSAGITDLWICNPAWHDFARLYSEVVRDCPLVLKRNGHAASCYLERLEISACEPSEAIVTANPGADYIGWKFTFTLSDARSFDMTFTSGYGGDLKKQETAST